MQRFYDVADVFCNSLCLVLGIVTAVLLFGCSTFSAATQLDELSDDQYQAALGDVLEEWQDLAAAALQEGEVAPDVLKKVAGAMHKLAAGELPLTGDQLAESFDLDGWGAYFLKSTMRKLERYLRETGALGDGLSERGAGLLEAAANGLEAAVAFQVIPKHSLQD